MAITFVILSKNKNIKQITDLLKSTYIEPSLDDLRSLLQMVIKDVFRTLKIFNGFQLITILAKISIINN